MAANTARTQTPPPHSGTVDPQEISRFEAMAAEWWDPHGKFRPLHKVNPVRLAHIRDTACAWFGRSAHDDRPLAGLTAVDIGCGGGLLAEPMARMGADVVGIDASEVNVRIAATHAAETGTAVDYRPITAEALAASGERFDIVLAMEVVEHVADVDLFLDACTRLMKPDGILFVATINRTAKSFALAIVGAEYILRWLPRGTHDWRKFLRPSEIAATLRPRGVDLRNVTGVIYNPLSDGFTTSDRDFDVNYMVWAARSTDR